MLDLTEQTHWMIECIYKRRASFYTRQWTKKCARSLSRAWNVIKRENTRMHRYGQRECQQTTLRCHSGWTKQRRILQHYIKYISIKFWIVFLLWRINGKRATEEDTIQGWNMFCKLGKCEKVLVAFVIGGCVYKNFFLYKNELCVHNSGTYASEHSGHSIGSRIGLDKITFSTRKSEICLSVCRSDTRVARFFLVQTYQNEKNIPNGHELYQTAIYYTKWLYTIPNGFILYQTAIYYTKQPYTIPNGHLSYQMAVKYNNILHSKALEIYPNWDFWSLNM
jgi:hypothetical protein